LSLVMLVLLRRHRRRVIDKAEFTLTLLESSLRLAMALFRVPVSGAFRVDWRDQF